jgi:hypothetical protein
MTAMHTVDLSGSKCVVIVRQKSTRVWVAHGDYMGNPIRTEDRSEEAALMRWQEVATSKGDPATRKPRIKATLENSSPRQRREKKASAKRRSPSAKLLQARKKPAQRK